MSCDERGAALLCGSVIACTSHGSVGAPAAHCTASARPPASIGERAAPCSHRRYPTRIPRLRGRIRFSVISWQATQRAEKPARPHPSGSGPRPAHHRRYPARSQRLRGRIRFPVISWQATQRAEKPARPHPSGSGPRPAHHRRYPARSPRLRGRIRFSVISWQATQRAEKRRSPASIRKRAAPRSSSALSNAHSTASRWHTLPRHLMAGSLATRPSPSPRPLQRPTSPYLSGSVISCTAPSSFSSIHPPRTASGGVALRQLRRAVIS